MDEETFVIKPEERRVVSEDEEKETKLQKLKRLGLLGAIKEGHTSLCKPYDCQCKENGDERKYINHDRYKFLDENRVN